MFLTKGDNMTKRQYELKRIANSSYPMANSNMNIRELSGYAQSNFKVLTEDECGILMQATSQAMSLYAPEEKYFAHKDFNLFYDKVRIQFKKVKGY
jgi:hypothetical protein